MEDTIVSSNGRENTQIGACSVCMLLLLFTFSVRQIVMPLIGCRVQDLGQMQGKPPNTIHRVWHKLCSVELLFLLSALVPFKCPKDSSNYNYLQPEQKAEKPA